MHTCLNVIEVFFYLDLYMCLCISYLGYILTLWRVGRLHPYGVDFQEEEV